MVPGCLLACGAVAPADTELALPGASGVTVGALIGVSLHPRIRTHVRHCTERNTLTNIDRATEIIDKAMGEVAMGYPSKPMEIT